MLVDRLGLAATAAIMTCMTVPQTILFPTDFSGRCDRPRDRAIQLARVWGAKLILLHVLGDDAATTVDVQEDIARAETRLRAEVQDDAIAVSTRLAFGDVAQAIIETSAEFGVDLIVAGISRHDEIGDFIVGTTVERLAQRGGLPVLIVKERAQQQYRQLMVATDFSACSATALRLAVAIFPAADLTLLHAYHVRLETLRGREGPAGDRQADIARDLEIFLEEVDLPAGVRDRLDINVDYGEICAVARDHVQSNNTDLAVVGTHGRSGLIAAMLGSTARALLACLDCDVLLVPQDKDSADRT